MAAADPLVSVVIAVHDGEEYVEAAVRSVLQQTLDDLELIVVDDGSTDRTPALLDAVADSRLRVLRREQRSGLAAALNLGLDEARGRYVARLDADDVALPRRLARQVAHLREHPALAVLGTAAVDIDERGRTGGVHVLPGDPPGVRWHALFSSPFFHPTVMLDRHLLEPHGLRYDESFPESEDYELWTRLLDVADGANLADPLVLRRRHAGQATRRRRELQRECQRRIALPRIEAFAPGLGSAEAELAWALGAGEPIPAGREEEAAAALRELVASFEQAEGRPGRVARRAGARLLGRAALSAPAEGNAALARAALALDPAMPARVLGERSCRGRQARQVRSALGPLTGSAPLRVAVVSPEPTPYRSRLFDRVAARDEVDLSVIYAARTVAGRTWSVEPAHRAVFLRGVLVPGARRLVRHDYPVTPGIVGVLGEARPDVVVVSGWSTFASQAALVWAEAHRVPFLLLLSSHEQGPRAGWRRSVRGAIVPRIVRRSSGFLVTGTLAGDSMRRFGAPAGRIRVFANTVDVEAVGAQAASLAPRRSELRAGLGLEEDDVAVLFVGRLVPEKDLEALVHAVARAGDPRLVLLLVGDGPERAAIERLARDLGVRVVLAGDLPWEHVVETYVAADVFALLSAHEPWGVVVNEAMACGLPVVLSDAVGAAPDLLHEGENGMLVPVGDEAAAAEALRALASDPELRSAYGARSREIVVGWGYEPSVESFVELVRLAAGR